MPLSPITMITLGVADLAKSRAFYETVFELTANPDYDGVAFFELPGTWLSLYPLDKLAGDIGPDVQPNTGRFGGFTLAHNAASRQEVDALCQRAVAAGARLVKSPRDTFWGGYSGYFADRDGHCWEVAWGPMFGLSPEGFLRFQT